MQYLSVIDLVVTGVISGQSSVVSHQSSVVSHQRSNGRAAVSLLKHRDGGVRYWLSVVSRRS